MPEDLSFLEDDRTAAQNRAFTQHDTLTFMGEELRPMTTGTFTLLQQTGNKLLLDSESPWADAAAFALIHLKDKAKSRDIRRMIWEGGDVFREYVFEFMEANPAIHEALNEAAPMFGKMITDYYAVLTRVAGSDGKKKHGAPAGSPG